MEQRLLAFEKDLVDTLEVINKQFKLSTAISQQKQNIQQLFQSTRIKFRRYWHWSFHCKRTG